MLTAARAYDDGWRMFIIAAEGPKWVSLIDFGTLRHQRVQAVDFYREWKAAALPHDEATLLRLLRRRRKFFRHAGAPWAPAVDQVLKLPLTEEWSR